MRTITASILDVSLNVVCWLYRQAGGLVISFLLAVIPGCAILLLARGINIIHSNQTFELWEVLVFWLTLTFIVRLGYSLYCWSHPLDPDETGNFNTLGMYR